MSVELIYPCTLKIYKWGCTMAEYVPKPEAILEAIIELESEGYDMSRARKYFEQGDYLRAYREVKWVRWRRNRQLRGEGKLPTRKKNIASTENVALIDVVHVPVIRAAWLETVQRLREAGFTQEQAEKMADTVEKRYGYNEYARITLHVTVDAGASISDIMAVIEKMLEKAMSENDQAQDAPSA